MRAFNPVLTGEMITTGTLAEVTCGGDRGIVQEGVPAAVPVEMCYLGRQESLLQLAKRVEPEIPD